MSAGAGASIYWTDSSVRPLAAEQNRLCRFFRIYLIAKIAVPGHVAPQPITAREFQAYQRVAETEIYQNLSFRCLGDHQRLSYGRLFVRLEISTVHNSATRGAIPDHFDSYNAHLQGLSTDMLQFAKLCLVIEKLQKHRNSGYCETTRHDFSNFRTASCSPRRDVLI